MSAANIVVLPDAAYLFADGAGYDREGRLRGVSSKIYPLSKLSAGMIANGRVVDSVYTASALQERAADFDDLAENIGDLLPNLISLCAGLFGDDDHGLVQRLVFAGWSAKRQACYGFGISTYDDVSGNRAFEPAAIEGGAQTPVLSQEELIRGFGRLPTMDDVRDIDNLALTTLELQRHHTASWDGQNLVGGFVELMTIGRDRLESRILKRWPDQVGEFIQPDKIDWPAWRAARGGQKVSNALAAAGIDISGLSRLQRERMQKKARKGTLRVAD